MQNWTEAEGLVYDKLLAVGALTSRRVQRVYGPRPNWHRLLTAGEVQEVRTVYGPVLTLTTAAHEREGSTMRLRGPGSLADRAYMLDAIDLLCREGYRCLSWEHKGGKVKGTVAAHVTRTRMQVPQAELDVLLSHWTHPKLSPERVGEPWLYARCSGGGVQLTDLRRLLKQHRSDLREWHAPLLIVTPKEDGPLRSFVRRYLAERQRAHEANQDRYARSVPHVPHLRIFELPLPRQVYRPSGAGQRGGQG